MLRMFLLNVCLLVAFSGASGCADATWLRKKPALPESLLESAAVNVDSPYKSNPAGDKSSSAETNQVGAATFAPGANKAAAAQSADARESFANAIERVSTNPDTTPQDYADLRRSLEQQDAGLPPIFKQQLLALLDVVERQSATDRTAAPVVLRAATAGLSSPVHPPRDPATRPNALAHADREPATVAAPHVTVNVHAGGAAGEAAPEAVAPTARHESKLDASEAKSPPNVTALSPTGENSRHSLAMEPSTVAKPAGIEPPFRPGEWRERVQHTIDALDFELRRDADELSGDERARLATYQRLLNVVADKHDAAVAPFDSPDKSQQQFWQHQLHALVVALDESGTPVLTRRAALALRELREAASHLAALSALDLRNLAFCTQVDGFGTFASFAKNEFKPDQEVLLYVEVDNFTVEEKSAGRRGELFETELRGSYQIFDLTGRRVADVELPLDKQACRSRRRDYFIAYPIYLPKKIEAGSYTLQLTIEDAKASKFGQGSIEFKIKP